MEIEDLLGRDSVQADLAGIGKHVAGKTILVTGGGGSIGSELCRQLATFGPAQLILFDIYENNAYDIQQELRRTYPNLNLTVLIGSVRDRERLEDLFARYHPDLIYHAAAHKHVPLMEDSPCEAVKNNIFGTLNVAEMADRYRASRFLLISSDKAVNPTNVMGATKRVCEMIIQMMDGRSKTEYVAVRFGNVLGSNGSVIPLFKKADRCRRPCDCHGPPDHPLLYDHPRGGLPGAPGWCVRQRRRDFLLDMGDPVRIDDLARNMIRLSGFEPDVDIPIVYTGLRPGEKLFEELLLSGEGMRKTQNDLIYIGKDQPFDGEKLEAQLQSLYQAAVQGRDVRGSAGPNRSGIPGSSPHLKHSRHKESVLQHVMGFRPITVLKHAFLCTLAAHRSSWGRQGRRTHHRPQSTRWSRRLAGNAFPPFRLSQVTTPRICSGRTTSVQVWASPPT